MRADLIASLPVQLTIFMVLFARLGASFMVVPILSEPSVPVRIRLAIALGCTLGLFGFLAAYVPPEDLANRLPALVIAELLTGLALGTVIRIMFLAISMAGAIVTVQTGLSSALVADPSQGGQTTVLSRLMFLAAIVLCMSLGIHHVLISALASSYELFPVGQLPMAQDFSMLAIKTLGQATTLALGLAAPLVVYGILFNLALGLAARVAPTLQVFFIAQPLNLLLGLALFAITLGTMLTVFGTRMTGWFQGSWG